MPLLVSDILTEAMALLNDQQKSIYKDDKMLPFVRKAVNEAQLHLHSNGLPLVKEIASALPVLAGATVLVGPTDMLYPMELSERASGNTGTYSPMDETAWEPDEPMQTTLGVWSWREEEVKFRGATTNREVRLEYAKAFAAIAGVNSAVPWAQGQTFYAARVAELGARYIGENEQRAASLAPDAERAKFELTNIAVKRMQGVPVRRPYLRRR
jgi:hypothetical protein